MKQIGILWTVLIAAIVGGWIAIVILEGRIYQRGTRNAITKIATTVHQRGQVTINTLQGPIVLIPKKDPNDEDETMKQCKHKFKPRYDGKWSTALQDLLNTGHRASKLPCDTASSSFFFILFKRENLHSRHLRKVRHYYPKTGQEAGSIKKARQLTDSSTWVFSPKTRIVKDF